MTDPRTCPKCGGVLPANAPSGVCPKCLMLAAMVGEESSQPDGSGDVYAVTTPQPGAFIPPVPASLAVHFPHLEILGVLGHGGMGAVYKARQTKLDRIVALKIIRPESADDPTFAERFNREARTLARLNHPNIVAVHDFGEVQLTEADPSGKPRRLYYFLMEYVDGMNLRQLMESGDVRLQQALAIIPQICEALQFAHDEGIVHRDIKPENVLIDSKGRVKIADYGLAKLAARSAEDFTLTATHQVMGTPRYMAPEQMTGSHHVDHRADIYSLGVVFYEMLTGEVPMGQFDPPSKRAPIDARLDEIVLRALAREPDRRFQRASEMKSSVEGISSASIELSAIPQQPMHRHGASTIMEREVAAAWHWVVGQPTTERNQPPQYPTLVTLLLSIAGALMVLMPWVDVQVGQASRTFVGTDFTSAIVASIAFALIGLLLIAIPERHRLSFGWNLCLGILAVAAMIATFVHRNEILLSTVRFTSGTSETHDQESSASIEGPNVDSVTEQSSGWPVTDVHRAISLESESAIIRPRAAMSLAVIDPTWMLGWQEPGPSASEVSSSSDVEFGPFGSEEGRSTYPIHRVNHRLTYLPGYYGSLGISIALLIISATGIRHSIADVKEGQNRSTSTGSPIARLRFSAPTRKNLTELIVTHFESHGYRLQRQTSGQWVFVRGTKIAGTYSFDIREYHTTVTVLTSFAREGWVWIHCLWSVRTMGAWITKKDIATLEGEGHELESMLKTEEAASPTLQVPDAPSTTQMHDSSAPAVDTPTHLTTPPPTPAASPTTSTLTPQPVVYDSTAGEPIDFDEVRAEVDGPSLAMIVVGMLMMIGHLIGVGVCVRHVIDKELFWLWVPGAIAGLGLFIGGLQMRSLMSRGWVQLGVIAGFIPFSPGWIFSAWISIWANNILNRPNVRRAFLQRRRQRKSEAAIDPGTGKEISIEEIRAELDGPSLAMIVVGMLMMIGHVIGVAILLDDRGNDELAWLWVPGAVAGLGLLLGGLSMRSLASRGMAQLGVIFGFLPVTPGIPLVMGISVWAQVVLNRPHIRKAFIRRRRELQLATQGSRQVDFVEVESDLSGPSLAMTAIGMLMMIGHGIAFGICLSSPYDDELAWLAVPGIVVGFGMFIGGLQMRSLLSRGWAQLGVIAGFIPASPGWIISMVVSIWANSILSRPDVRLAFLQRRRERSQPRSLSAQPRFSRKAIVGAMWAGLFFLLLVPSVVISDVGMWSGSSEMVFDEHGQPAASDAPVYATPTWFLIFTLPILLAPIGTTILGSVAISDIKHSQGRVTGLGLAVTDTLLFPLLLLNGAIFAAFLYFFSEVTGMESAMTLFISLGAAASVGYGVSASIVQHVWKSARNENDDQSPPDASQVDESEAEHSADAARDRQTGNTMSIGSVVLWLILWAGLVVVIGAATYQSHREAWGFRYQLEDASPGVLIPNSGAYALRMTAFASGHSATMMSEGQVKRDHVELEIEDADYHYQLIVTLPDLEFTYDYPGISSRSFERGFSKAVLLDWMRGCGVDVRRPGIETEVDAIFETVRGAFHTPLGDLVDRQLFEASVGDISFSISHEEEWAHLTWCLVVGGVWLIATLLLTWVWNGLPERRGLTRFAWGVAWIFFPMLLAFGPWFYWEGLDRLRHEMNNDPYGRSALLLAVVHEDADEVRRLIDRGASPNDGWRSLFCAAGLGNREITRELLIAGADVDAPGDFGITPLMFASALGHADVVKLLLNAGANPQLQDYGVTSGSHSVIDDYFVGVGSPAGQEVTYWWPGNNQTPLMLAIREGHADVVQLLLEAGASIDIADGDFKTAADYVNESDDLEVKHVFEEYLHRHSDDAATVSEPAGVVTEASSNLNDAAVIGDLDRVLELHTAGASVNATDAEGRTPLMLAAANGHSSLCIILMLLGADATVQDNDGYTALMLAIENGHSTVVERFAELREISGRNPSDPTFARQIQTMSGIEWSTLDETLLVYRDYQIGLDQQDMSGESALMMLASRGDVDGVRRLCDYCAADRTLQDSQGRTALMHALVNDQTEFVETLARQEYTELEQEEPYNHYVSHFLYDQVLIVDNDGKSAYQLAAELGHETTAELLRNYLQLLILRNTQAIELGPREQGRPLSHWYRQRALAHQALGDEESAEADFEMSRQLESTSNEEDV